MRFYRSEATATTRHDLVVAAGRRGRRRRLRATNSPIDGTAKLLGFSDETTLDVAPGAPYTITIEPLRQSLAVDAGYSVRISAGAQLGGLRRAARRARTPAQHGDVPKCDDVDVQ